MTEKVKELKAVVKAMSDALMADISIDATSGVATPAEDIYNKHLPEGITPEIVKNISEHNTNFVAASRYAFGVTAVAAMKANPELQKATIDIPMGYKDNLHIAMVARTELPNDKGIEYGNTHAVLTVRAGSNGSQLKIVNSLIAEMAATALK
jgi:hypothetical protein